MAGSEWKRLGLDIVRRRNELGMITREQLADATGLSARMLGDLEKARRTNFDPGALARVEIALHWEAGSIERILAGKEPIVSGVIRDGAGRPLSHWRSIEGAEQADLELNRLAYVVMDTRDLVRSQKGPLMTALSALLDEAADLVVRQIARRSSSDDVVSQEALSAAQLFVERTRDSNNIRRQGSIYVNDMDSIRLAAKADLDEMAERMAADRFKDPADREFGRKQAAQHDSEQESVGAKNARLILHKSLIGHYGEMMRRALPYLHHDGLAQQARQQLGNDTNPAATVKPEVPNNLYVQYLAARLSTPAQGGDPDLHDKVLLTPEEYDAARSRYQREFAEMALFRRLRTVGAPPTSDFLPPVAEKAWPPAQQFVAAIDSLVRPRLQPRSMVEYEAALSELDPIINTRDGVVDYMASAVGAAGDSGFEAEVFALMRDEAPPELSLAARELAAAFLASGEPDDLDHGDGHERRAGA